jgi:glycosyltransferase involved in cell wall biosynthesis
MKKVLLVSYTALMASTANGRTMQSLLQGIPAENLSLFCCYGAPDKNSCASCYKVSNKDAVKSLLKAKNVGRLFDMEVQQDSDKAVQKDQRIGPKKAWKYLAKELAWALGRWKNKKFKTWLNSLDVDCVIYMYGDHPSLQNLAVYASKKLDVPLVVYSCEDYCFKDYNYLDHKKPSFWFFVYQKLSRAATRKLFRRAAGLITNSDRLGKEYKKKYGIDNLATVMVASQMECVHNGDVRDVGSTSVTYLGTLGVARIKALIEIGDTLQKINPRLKMDVYGRTTREFEAQLANCRGICYHGFVSYEEVQKVMWNSTLLIETLINDPYVNKNKRYGFSTKYADCFACGTPLLVYASEEIIETAFALEHDCAFVSTSPDTLEETLRTALFDQEAREEKLNAAARVTATYFNKEKNIQTVAEMLDSVVHKN